MITDMRPHVRQLGFCRLGVNPEAQANEMLEQCPELCATPGSTVGTSVWPPYASMSIMSPGSPVPKVSCFVLHPATDRLLVFSHPDHPDAGIQVPAGTIEPGEDPAAAAVREAEEETGFAGYTVLRFLDRRTLTEERQGDPQIHDRWFFHLTPPAGLPDAWDHGEGDPAGRNDGWIRFHFFWLDAAVNPLPLTPDHAAVLRESGITDSSAP